MSVKANKTERQQVRRTFTTCCNTYDTLFAAEVKDITALEVQYVQIKQKHAALVSLNEKIKDGMLSEETIDKALEKRFSEEYDRCDEYNQRFITISILHRQIMVNSRDDETDDTASECGSTASKAQSTKKNLKYPKIEIKPYDGNLLGWINFWEQFKKIHQDTEVTDADKFQYLLKSLVPDSEAEAVVQPYPPSGENYPKAINALHEAFANEELLVEMYSRELCMLRDKVKGLTLFEIYKKVLTHLNCLETLGVTTDKCAALLVPMVESVVHPEVLLNWNRYKETNNLNFSAPAIAGQPKANKLQVLMKYIKGEAMSQRNVKLTHDGWTLGDSTGISVMTNTARDQTPVPTAAGLVSLEGKVGPGCIFCDKNNHTHSSVECSSASRFTYEERENKVKDKGVCRICLKRGHFASKCRSKIQCVFCRKRHFALMCPDLAELSKKQESTEKTENCLCRNNVAHDILMQTLIVYLVGPTGKRIKVRVLLDSASQRSYILKECAETVALQQHATRDLVHCLFGGQNSDPVTHRVYNICLEDPITKFRCQVEVLDQKTICANVPRCTNLTVISALRARGINISDYGEGTPRIDVLLGADFISTIATGNKEHCDGNLYAIETLLGWTLMGKTTSMTEKSTITSFCLINNISDLWDLDMLGIRDPIAVQNKEQMQEEAIAQFNKNVYVNTEGRYEVPLPWLPSRSELTSNEFRAHSQLVTLTTRLKRKGIFNEYDAIFQDWEKEGIIEKAFTTNGHFLPHHAVIKESETTKIRPVFNGSAIDSNGHSLNDCLQKGANLTELIPDVILKFRLKKIGVIADIRKAFLQIGIRPEDRDHLKFYWWGDDQGTIQIYRHRRVVFGLTCSPFLLSATLKYHLDQSKDDPNIIEILKTGYYVDNLAASVDNENDLEYFVGTTNRIMLNGKFELRGWRHNRNGIQVNFCDSEEPVCKLLGIKWNTQEDRLFCLTPTTRIQEGEKITKRKLLSLHHQVYDPIGVMEPAILIPKLILREAWERNLDWDTELPTDLKNKVLAWHRELHLIESHTFNRYLGGPIESLHVFSDASKDAYAAVVFARTINERGEIATPLLAARSKLAPVEKPSIPRLELLGALIAVRLANKVTRIVSQELPTTFWTDSTIVLNWIRNAGPWSVFVNNRIQEIKRYSDVESWRHVPGKDNPADLPSRGCPISELNEWWKGPTWLSTDPQNWPHEAISYSTAELNLERRPAVIANLNVNQDSKIINEIFEKISKYSKAVRTIAWIFRFWNNSSNRHSKIYEKTLTTNEIRDTETRIFKYVQDKHTLIDKPKNFETITDDNGILRVKTRLTLGDFDDDFRKPILLPAQEVVVKRLIEEEHRTNYHPGAATLHCILRNQFWIIRGKKTIREIVHDCLPCRKQKIQPAQCPTAPLPAHRVNLGPVFGVTGIDLAGPLLLKDNSKVWIVLYTCAVYRAVYLDLVLALSTEAFVRSLKRMIARRGRPQVIYTDNGSNFAKTDKQLQLVNWEEISTHPALCRIDWRFNPPSSPWWGGFWERLIRSLKDILKRNLGNSSLTLEEMYTATCDTENVLNNRPLTYVYSANNELRPLTPSVFLYNLPCSDTPDLDQVCAKNLDARATYLQNVITGLKNRFQKEYLSALVQCPRQDDQLQVGELVLISADNKKRIQWPIGRILELLPGADGLYRVARVKTANGELIRPFQRLFPLEISASETGRSGNKLRVSETDSNVQDFSIVTEKFCDTKDNTGPGHVPDVVDEVPQEIEIKTRLGRLITKPKKLDL